MDTKNPDQKQDPETGDWVSDLKPGASTDRKADKAVEDTFPASDPANMNTGTTGFITPSGKDLGEAADRGGGEAGTVSGGKP
ncbi:MAG TPA: hypothetical protein VIL69_10920 [Roseomonas sp.]|jgi:hypothetical protein